MPMQNIYYFICQVNTANNEYAQVVYDFSWREKLDDILCEFSPSDAVLADLLEKIDFVH